MEQRRHRGGGCLLACEAVKRREAESLARRHLDATLNRRGFVLCPQPPPDHEDKQPRAIFEDDTEDYPGLRERFGGEVPAGGEPIDIEIRFDPGAGRLSCELDGDPLPALLTELGAAGRAGQLTQPAAGDLGGQLDTIAAALGYVLDAHTREQP